MSFTLLTWPQQPATGRLEPSTASESRILRPDAGGPRVARELVASVAAGADLLSADQRETATLLASELVTNALLHGEPDISLTVVVWPAAIRVEVHDRGQFLPGPAAGPASPMQPNGRGLIIVDALAAEWGVTATAPGPGKMVWFELYAPALSIDAVRDVPVPDKTRGGDAPDRHV